MFENAKGFKGFEKGLVCRGKQYAENSVFEEKKAIVCKSGMHYCVNPFDVLDHYDLVNANGEFNEFADVEALEPPRTDDEKRFCTTKLKVGAKLSFAGFVKTCVNFILEKTAIEASASAISDKGANWAKIGSSGDGAKIGSSGDGAQIGSSGCGAKIGSSGDGAKIGSSGYGAKIGSSGYGAQIGSSGYGAQIGSSGDRAKIGSSGDRAKIGSSGYGAQIGSSGYGAKIGSSGYGAQIGSSGYGAQIGSSGDGAQIGSSGDRAKIGSSGYGAQIGSSGDGAQIGSSGYGAKIGSSGYGAKIGSSGYGAQINSSGASSVLCCAGNNSRAKAGLGSWITLAEWKADETKGRMVPVCVKTEFVDGKRIKIDTWYQLKDGIFVECEVDE